MFPDLSKFLPMLQLGLDDLKTWLGHLYTEAKGTREAAQRQARALDFEFGVVDVQDSPQIAPRRLTSIPLVVEEAVNAREEVDVLTANQGRAPSRGFYANLGENPFKVILIGVNGQATAPHTVPPATTISLPCLVSKIIIEPVDGKAANYQLYLY